MAVLHLDFVHDPGDTVHTPDGLLGQLLLVEAAGAAPQVEHASLVYTGNVSQLSARQPPLDYTDNLVRRRGNQVPP